MTKGSASSPGKVAPAEDLSGGVPARAPDPVPVESLSAYKRFWAWWLPKAARIAFKQNAVISWLAYYLGMSGVGLWMRRQDRLDRAPRPAAPSAWTKRTEPMKNTPRSARRPF